MTYLKIAEIKNMLKEHNENNPKEKELNFKLVVDHSLINPRVKELHNVIIGKNCRIVTAAESKQFWKLEVNGEFIFRGCLASCFERYAEL